MPERDRNGGLRLSTVPVADDVTILEVRGEVIETAAEALVREVRATTGAVVVDLTKCRRMDSNGFGALLDGWRLLRERNRQMVVAYNPQAQALRPLIQAIGGNQVLPLFESRDDAIKAATEQNRRSNVYRQT
jgi:anti-anti-sigma factor